MLPKVPFDGALEVIEGPELVATAINPDVLVREAVTVSVAVMVCDPGVSNVTINWPDPFVSVTGLVVNIACASLLVSLTVPE